MTKLVVGCGYVGMRVARMWRRQEHRVCATTRSAAHADAFRCEGLEPVICDVLNPATLTQLPAADTVLYSVGHDRGAGQDMRDVYVAGLANVLDHLPTPQRFLHISSTSVYGQTAGEWVDEQAATAPREASGRIVLEAEQLLRQRLPDAVLLRFAGIYGPGRLQRREALLTGTPIVGDGERWLNLIHVEDGVAAVLAAERSARPGAIYNVCDDCPAPRREFYAEIARLLGAPPPRFIPPPPGTPAPAHDSANRRIANRKLRDELHVALSYPSYKEGLPAAL